MNQTVKILLIAFIVYALTSCRPASVVTTQSNRHDSIVYLEREIVKDSLVRVPVPADSALIEAYVECDSMNQAHIAYIIRLQDGSRASASVALANNVLTVGCKCDSLAIYTIYHSRYQSLAESVTSTTQEASATVVRPHWLDGWLIHIMLFLLTALVVFFSINYIIDYVKAFKNKT